MKKRFMDFMRGRYGADQLSKFMLGVCLVCLILNMVTRQPVVYVLALVILVICYFRMFSKNTYKRSAENQKYLDMTGRVRNYFSRMRRRIVESKDYHIYKCPSCSQKIRIPRGKGKICITCPKCRTEFEKKS